MGLGAPSGWGGPDGELKTGKSRLKYNVNTIVVFRALVTQDTSNEDAPEQHNGN